MAKLTLSSLTSSYRSNAALNANFDAIEAAIENTLSRDGTSPNAMAANFDMGSNLIVNLSDPVSAQDGATKSYVDGLADTVADINAITHADGVFVVSDGTDWVGESGATARASMGVTIGTDVQAYDAGLEDISGLATADGNIIVGDGNNWVGESGATARASLGVSIDTDVQAYDAGLASIAGLTTAADKMIYTTALDTYAVTDLTSFARTVLDDATAKAARTTLEVNTKYVATISALKALTGGDFDMVEVGGHTSANDGGGGVFAWDASDTTTDDNGWYIQPNAGGTGRWIRTDRSVANVKHFGATGVGAADDTSAIQAAFDASDNIFFPAGVYRTTAAVTKTGSSWVVSGAGPELTRVNPDVGSFDVFQFDNGGSSIRETVFEKLSIFSDAGDRTAGAFIRCDDRTVNCKFNEIYADGFYDFFKIDAPARTYFTDIWYFQTQRTSGKAQYAFHFIDDAAAIGKVTDVHLDNVQGWGEISGGGTGLLAHIYIEAMDGLYIDNCHFVMSDWHIITEPDNVGDAKFCLALHVSNTYFDYAFEGHVWAKGTADSYGQWLFSNCLFRAAQGTTGSFVIDADMQKVTLTGCHLRIHNRDGFVVTPGHTVTDFTIRGCLFDQSNADNVAGFGDIDGVFDGLEVSDNLFLNGGANGTAITIATGSTNVRIIDNAFNQSTAGTIISDSGTLTEIRGNSGYTSAVAFAATAAASNLSLTVAAQQVLYSGEEYDLNADFDPAAGEFVAPFDGLYSFHLNCQFINVDRGYVNTSDAGAAVDPVDNQSRIDIQLRKDTGGGNSVVRRWLTKSTSNEENFTATSQLQLNAGDIINLAVANLDSASGDLRLTGTGFHEFSGRLIERTY